MKSFRNSSFLGALLLMTCMSPVAAGELVSLDLVRQSSGSQEARMPYEAATVIREGDRLELVSADGYDFGLSVSNTTVSGLGNRIIRASTDAGGKALLVVGKDGQILGSVTELGERYQISTTADGQRRLIKEGYLDYEKRLDDGGVAPQKNHPVPEMPLELREDNLPTSFPQRIRAEQSSNVIYPTYKAGTAQISVLMYYDDSMSNPFSKIDFITQVANDAYADSDSNIKIEIVGTKALSIDDDTSHRDLKSAMSGEEAPFEEIESDRSFFEADLVYLLRDTEAPDGEDPCGIATLGVYNGNHVRYGYTGLVQWKPADGVGTYCSDYSFAHEVGHSLGARHNRESYVGDTPTAAYSYSFGVTNDGVFRTVMGVSSEFAPRLGLFSSPDLDCNGYPCGKPAARADSADNVSTFRSTGHLVASFEGPFAFEAVSVSPYGTNPDNPAECTTSDDKNGYSTGVALVNQSSYDVDIKSMHFLRPDGTFYVVSFEPGERTAEPGSASGGAVCRPIDAEPWFGGTYLAGFVRYKHPETGESVETELVRSNADGEYRVVRAASSQGGSVSGNPTQSVRVGSSQTFTFIPDNGYAVASIQSNCSGRKSGNNYSVDVGQDDCFVEATFQQVAASETLRLSIENPASGLRYSGIGTFQGWAVAQEGIDRVDLYVDGAFFQSAPYGGSRGDVGNIFPDVPNSKNSGFALAYNFGDLSDGTHTLKAIAVTENGRTFESSVQFSVAKFHKPFIGAGDSVSLGGAYCSVTDSSISVQDAMIDGRPYDVYLEWRTATQGFEIYRIR